jgi:translation initiation factor IF-2
MAGSGTKLFKIASQINIGRDAIVEYLASKGFAIENKATTALTDEMVDLVNEKFNKELKVAEKQREKVERQRQVRKSLQEQGDTVSIDSIAERHERDAEVETRMEAGAIPPSMQAQPAESPAPVVESREPLPPPTTATPPVAVEPEPPVEPPAAAPVVGDSPSAPPVDVAPPAAPVSAESVTEATPAESPSAEPVDTTADDTAPVPPAPPKKSGPAVGAVIDLSKVGPPPVEPEPPAPPPSAEVPAETPADADEPKEKKKRKRVAEVEVTHNPNAKLKGLTVVGRIDVSAARGPQRSRPARPGDSRGTERPNSGRPTLGDSMADRGQRTGTSGTSGVAGPSTPRATGGPYFGADAKKSPVKRDEKKKRKTPGAKSVKDQVSDKDVDRAIRQTLSGMEDAGGTGRAKGRLNRKREREIREMQRQEDMARESSTLRLSEFVTTADLANMMRVSAAEIIMKCMGLGLMVSINQRLDRETIILIADDYKFQVEFLDDQASQEVEDIEDAPETLKPRSPIVTIMGHVDHGKTSLLDYIRNTNVVAGEAGGITQHIGAYRVELENGRSITFLDTPGHEAFTAMRARGAQVTDIVILVVAADDSVMPQTIEAISHAQAANVPIVVAINKIDRPEANPDKIKQQLADHGVLVEEWGGKYQCAEISAKQGLNVDQLLEKILIEADLMDLKANPDRLARATVIEAHVDKGRGNVVTLIVQKGTLNVGDIFVCGQFAGRVRAMTDERGHRIESAGPSMPVQVTGFDGLPNAGDILVEMATDAEAREVANRRQQIRREQQFRGMRHMTLDDISAQISAGGVKELRLVVKGDVSGSVEALSDSLQKLSTNEVQVRILYKAVGAISESDIMLASASDAIIVGFQVNISPAARKLAENEDVEVRLYSIIYDCINEVQLALEGLLTPDLKEEITAVVEVRATFKISRLGTIAGCYVQSGKITRNDKVRVLRDGFEIYKGTLTSLKRVKDDVREVDSGYECGIGIQGFNDIEVGDIIESYRTIEIKRTLQAN